MTSHSILPPSGAAVWKKCAMWPTMNQSYPEEPTPESMEGEAAHWVMAEMLKGNVVTKTSTAPNGIIVTDEMIEGAELVYGAVDFNEKLHIEEWIPISNINSECFGTPDIWSYSYRKNIVKIYEYKFGHKFIDEIENDQCVMYYLGVKDLLKLSEDNLKVEITIIQPRCYHGGSAVRTWSARSDELLQQTIELRKAAVAALESNPVATTNEGCQYCPGRHACPALQKAAYDDAEIAYQSAPVNMSPAAADLELKMLERAKERLDARVDGLREYVLSMIKQGKQVHHHSRQQSYGRQRWTISDAQVIIMGKLFNADLAKNDVVTPNQAKKLGVDERVINAYSHTPVGGIKLVKENPNDVSRIFNTKE